MPDVVRYILDWELKFKNQADVLVSSIDDKNHRYKFHEEIKGSSLTLGIDKSSRKDKLEVSIEVNIDGQNFKLQWEVPMFFKAKGKKASWAQVVRKEIGSFMWPTLLNGIYEEGWD